jgi:hypothetical protein
VIGGGAHTASNMKTTVFSEIGFPVKKTILLPIPMLQGTGKIRMRLPLENPNRDSGDGFTARIAFFFKSQNSGKMRECE